MQKRFVVQDLMSKGFLCSSPDCDITFSPWIKSAFHFESFESACLTALYECDQGYQIFSFFVPDKDFDDFCISKNG